MRELTIMRRIQVLMMRNVLHVMDIMSLAKHAIENTCTEASQLVLK